VDGVASKLELAIVKRFKGRDGEKPSGLQEPRLGAEGTATGWEMWHASYGSARRLFRGLKLFHVFGLPSWFFRGFPKFFQANPFVC